MLFRSVGGIAWEEVQPPRWIVHPDGSYSGTAFEGFSADEVRVMAAKWPHLDFPNVLCEVDDFLANEFANQRIPVGHPTRMKRLEGLLAHKNGSYRALAAQVTAKVVTESADCWFDGDRLMVANGFKDDLMGLVGGSEDRLRITLDKAAASVPMHIGGVDLKRIVRGQFARNVDWDRRDDRKTEAVVKRGAAPSHVGEHVKPRESFEERQRRRLAERASGRASE